MDKEAAGISISATSKTSTGDCIAVMESQGDSLCSGVPLARSGSAKSPPSLSPPPLIIPTRSGCATAVVPPAQSSKPNKATTMVLITPLLAALQINGSAAGSGAGQDWQMVDQHPPQGTVDFLSQMEAGALATSPVQVPRENLPIETLQEWGASLRVGNGRKRNVDLSLKLN